MERVSKLVVLGWMLAGLAAEAWLLKSQGLQPIVYASFTAALALAFIDRRTVALTLALAYLFPALIHLTLGGYDAQFAVIWMAAVVGAILPDAVRRPWQLPSPWRGALLLSALVIMVGAPIVIWREIDFNPVLLLESREPWSALGGVPAMVVRWVLHVSLVLLLGIVWFDWLFGLSAAVFQWFVVTPLAMSGLAMSGVSIYQLFVDRWFLNENVYGVLGRASGTLFDANVAGTIAAMWTGGALLWAQRLGRGWRLVAIGGACAAWLAVWASGSRTALAAALVVAIFSAASAWRARRDRPAGRRILQLALAAGVVVAAAALLDRAGLSMIGPIERVRNSAPDLSLASLRTFAVNLLWVRDNYGLAANAVIREFPLVGLGPGCFHVLASFFIPTIPGDNAQSWYRHQLAEFGLLGSLGWIVWVVSFAIFVMRRRKPEPAGAPLARGMLLAFALISIVGMPSQEVSAAFTFWTMAFWFVSIVAGPATGEVVKPGLGRWSWAAIAVVLVAYGALTATQAAHELRPPVRAQRIAWPYSYGFYWPEPDGQGGEFRWARRRAVAVVDTPKPWVAIRVGVNHRDVQARPVDVKVWGDGQLILDTRLASAEPVTRYVRVARVGRQFMVETRVSRVVRPRELGVADDRELGLMVSWTFVDGPPAGAMVAPR